MPVSHKLLLSLTLLLLLSSFNSTGASAEGLDIHREQRVRIDADTTIKERIVYIIPYSHTATRKVIGNLISCSDDSIVIVDSTLNGETHFIPTSSVKRFYVSVGKKRQTLRGMMIGAGLGAVLGIFSILGDPDVSNGDDPDAYVDNFPQNALAITGIGALIGGVIGWNFKADRWHEIERDEWPVDLSVSPTKKGLQLGFSYLF
jgi:hypothetical protein